MARTVGASAGRTPVPAHSEERIVVSVVCDDCIEQCVLGFGAWCIGHIA
jgi:hypothetical protein